MKKPPVQKPIKAPRRPIFTYLMIIVCIGVFLISAYLSVVEGKSYVRDIIDQYGFSFEQFSSGGWWTFVTSAFFHASPVHLILNMLALFFFGKAVEEELGGKTFLLIFFASAIAGNVAVSISAVFGIMSATVPTIGASAATFGLMGAAMLVRPFDLVFYPYVFPVPLVLVSVIYILYNIGEFVAVVSGGYASQVAYIAHIGGLVAGAYLGLHFGGMRRGLIALAAILLILFLIPTIMSYLGYADVFNYSTVLSDFFG